MFLRLMQHKNNPKKILYLRTDLGLHNLQAGGSVTHTIGVINGFLYHGFAIDCATAAMHTIVAKMGLNKLLLLNMPRILRFLGCKINCIFSNIFFTASILFFFKKQEYLFIYQRYSLLNITGVLIAWFKRVPLILEYNGSEVWVDKHWNKKKKLHLLFLINWFEKINLKYASQIIVVSDALRAELVRRGINSQKILVNPNGVDVQRFNPAILDDSRTILRSTLNMHNKFVFGFVGTFSYWHGIDIIAQMIINLVAHADAIHFLLIGDGPLKKQLEQQLTQANVPATMYTLTGTIPYETVEQYLAACDAFLLPTQPNPDGSAFFGSPTKLFEYMSMAKPIIASDVGQIGEILFPYLQKKDIENNMSIAHATSILIDANDIDGFYKAALFLMQSNAEEAKIWGTNARNKVIEQYSWHTHVQKILDKVNAW